MVVLSPVGPSTFVQIYPGNSLRPLRALAPYLAAAALLVVHARVGRLILRCFLYGIVGGILLWWSNDFGMPAAMLAVAVAAIDLTLSRRWSASNIGLAMAGALIAGPLSLLALTGGHAVRLLRYNLNDVAHDQWWYFGPWGADRRIFLPSDATIILSPGTVVALLVLAATAVWACRRRDVPAFLLPLIGGATFLGGFVASYGGHYQPEYFHPFQWWALIAGVCLTARAARLDQRVGALPSRAVAIAISAAALVFAAGGIGGRAILAQRMEADPGVYRDAALGGFLDTAWRPYVQGAQASRVPFVEEYWGLWSAARQQRVGRVDSIIHALGSERDRFAERMAAMPPLVTTSRPSVTDVYQGWGLSVNWWFYAHVLKNYRIAGASPNTFAWVRARQPDWSPVFCRVAPDGSRLMIAAQPGELIDIAIRYRTAVSPRSLLMVRNVLGMDGGWSPLDPAAAGARFPVLLDEKTLREGVRFRILPDGRSGQVTINACSASLVPRRSDVDAILPTGA